MSKPSQLYLLADHVKLSLLERQRAKALHLDGDTQDGHLSRSLDQFRAGLASLRQEKERLEQAGDDGWEIPLRPPPPFFHSPLSRGRGTPGTRTARPCNR